MKQKKIWNFKYLPNSESLKMETFVSEGKKKKRQKKELLLY